MVNQLFFFLSKFVIILMNRRVSVAHMDSPNVVDKGLNQMLSTFVNHRLEDDLDVLLLAFAEL